MIEIDPITPADRLPKPTNSNRIEDCLVEFVDLRIESDEGSVYIGPVPAPAGLSKAGAAVWLAEVYYPQVVLPKARHLLNILGDAPGPEDIAMARRWMLHGGEA